jgi:hypothetical protein
MFVQITMHASDKHGSNIDARGGRKCDRYKGTIPASSGRNIRLNAPLTSSFFNRIEEDKWLIFFSPVKKTAVTISEGCYRTTVARTSSSTIMTGEPRLSSIRYAMAT